MRLNDVITEGVADLLRSQGLPQTCLVTVLRLSQPSINDRFRCRTRWTTEDVELIAEHFGVDLSDLLMPRVAS
ncbi:MAG: hypothetical protein KJ792_02780 [Actinobacteria bacterium]|nr:hypothetical protein [Actinomycetota bacterium]MCG2800489.1 hypothetical protein [Cellulomonas sp.]